MSLGQFSLSTKLPPPAVHTHVKTQGKLNMNTAAFNSILHFIIGVFYIYTLHYNFANLRHQADTYGGKFKFLTVINLCLQTGYFIFAFFNDIFGSNLKITDDLKKRSSLQRLRDYIFNSVVFPCGVFVVVSFWGIYAVDRELVYPAHLDKIIPQWHNHALHTTVLPLVVLEKILVYHHYDSKRTSVLGTVCFALVYLVWVFWIHFYADIWVYPVLAVLNWPQRICFIVVLSVILGIICLAGERLTHIMWKKKMAVKKLS